MKKTAAIAIIIIISVGLASCYKDKQFDAPPDADDVKGAPTAIGTGSDVTSGGQDSFPTGGSAGAATEGTEAKPANTMTTETAGAAQKPEKPTEYMEGQVVDEKDEGHIEVDTIKSKYPCKVDHDCTSTKYENVPKSQDDCTCAAPCTPFVVNVKEKNLRENANKKFCGPHNWYGARCPAPECRFEEFDGFKCENGLCEGFAEGNR